MQNPRPSLNPGPRAAKVVVTVLAVVAALLVANTMRGGQDESASTLSTQSLLTIPGVGGTESTPVPTPTPIATTAPVESPTATPVPTSTATPAPTATAEPTTAPEPTEVQVEVADAGSATLSLETRSAELQAQPSEPAPTEAPAEATAAPATPVPEPTAEPTAEPTSPPAPTATPLPTATAVAVATPEPTVEPTPEPTPTPTPLPAQSAAQLEAYVLGEINRVRANAGLGPVTLDPAISNIARDWSQQMALGGFFQHRPGSELNVMLPAGWLQWGENIASAPDIYYAQSSLEQSPGHYANMVGNFTHVGIGVYTNGSQVWLTHNFARY